MEPIFVNETPSGFKVGDVVTAKAFTNCLDKIVPAIPNVTIMRIRLMPASSIPAYYRLYCEYGTGLGAVEGSERFFTR